MVESENRRVSAFHSASVTVPISVGGWSTIGSHTHVHIHWNKSSLLAAEKVSLLCAAIPASTPTALPFPLSFPLSHAPSILVPLAIVGYDGGVRCEASCSAVLLDWECSEAFDVEQGVPLRILFSVFINCLLKEAVMAVLLEATLQFGTKAYRCSACLWRLKANVSKSAVVVFSGEQALPRLSAEWQET